MTTVGSYGHKVLLLYLFCLDIPYGWCQGEATATAAGEDLELSSAGPLSNPPIALSQLQPSNLQQEALPQNKIIRQGPTLSVGPCLMMMDSLMLFDMSLC